MRWGFAGDMKYMFEVHLWKIWDTAFDEVVHEVRLTFTREIIFLMLEGKRKEKKKSEIKKNVFKLRRN